jgi:hypothetical protein
MAEEQVAKASEIGVSENVVILDAGRIVGHPKVGKLSRCGILASCCRCVLQLTRPGYRYRNLTDRQRQELAYQSANEL